MQKAKVDCLVVLFAYSGNGGVASTIPQLVWWMAKTYHAMKQDERIGKVYFNTLCDTPITMTRNRAVVNAQKLGCDMVLMLDSDNEPDGYLASDPDAKPFWDTAFTFAYDRLLQGLPTVAFAPYCGPPPQPIPKPGVIDNGEIPYLFQWIANEGDVPHPSYKLDILNRNQAALLKGIHPMPAGPTGVSLWTLSAFEGVPQPYFAYEMTPDGAEKQSTEDVYATRNVSLFWRLKISQDVVFAMCDSWAMHHKTKIVGKPFVMPVESIAETFRQAMKDDVHIGESIRNLALPERGEAVEERRTGLTELVYGNNNGHKQNGVRYRMIGGHKVGSHAPLSDADVDAIGEVVMYAAQQAGGRPLRMACLYPGDGQEALAMLACAPEQSVVYCVGPTDGEYRANIGGVEGIRSVPGDPIEKAAEMNGEALDVVFCNSDNGAAEKAWKPHLSPDGVFVGHYPRTDVRIIEGSNVWFIPAPALTE